MARIQITYWRDIPVLVRAWAGSDEATIALSQRFQELVDLVAMQEGLSGSEDYLAQWRTGPEGEQPGPAGTVAQAAAAALEARFAEIRGRALRSATATDPG